MQAQKLSTEEKHAGSSLFPDRKRTHCVPCHNGLWLRNRCFNNIVTGRFTGEHNNFGRSYGLRSVPMDGISCLDCDSGTRCEQFSELKSLSKDDHEPLERIFKVPRLLIVAASTPCLHAGCLVDLKSVLNLYRHRPDKEQDCQHEIPELDIADANSRLPVHFLKSLSAVSD